MDKNSSNNLNLISSSILKLTNVVKINTFSIHRSAKVKIDDLMKSNNVDKKSAIRMNIDFSKDELYKKAKGTMGLDLSFLFSDCCIYQSSEDIIITDSNQEFYFVITKECKEAFNFKESCCLIFYLGKFRIVNEDSHQNYEDSKLLEFLIRDLENPMELLRVAFWFALTGGVGNMFWDVLSWKFYELFFLCSFVVDNFKNSLLIYLNLTLIVLIFSILISMVRGGINPIKIFRNRSSRIKGMLMFMFCKKFKLSLVISFIILSVFLIKTTTSAFTESSVKCRERISGTFLDNPFSMSVLFNACSFKY